MKKWIIAVCVGLIGLILLAVGVKLNGDLDAYYLSQPGPHGQFTGSGRGLLLWFFFILLAGVSLLAALVSAITAGLKWRCITFQKVRYPNLFYWTLCIPVAVYLICFPSWALWHTVGDYLKYLK